MTARPTDPSAAGNPPDRRQALLAALIRERYGPLAELEAERHADPPTAIARRRRKLTEEK